MSWYNTTRLAGPELARREQQASTQESRLLRFFERHPGVWYANHELFEIAKQKYPITSIQRCLTNLTIDGKLEKSERTMKVSPYGIKVHAWKLREGL